MAIPLPIKGSAPTLVDTAYATRLISSVNALMAALVQPSGTGSVISTDTSVTLDLSPLTNRLQALETALQNVIGSGNNSDILKRLNALEDSVTNINNQITNINQRLDNATVMGSGVCNSDGSVSISITITI